MKIAVKICKIFMLLLGGFFIFMSFDSFDGTDSVWNMILEFLINASPGVVLIALTFILWHKELLLGIIILVGAIGLFFLFKFYRDINEKWITILTVEVPMLTAGCLLLFSNKNQLR
ncbi:MAG: hypothetical protein KKH92_00950 [Firmicutes bacterium]|nr:hypothetical protein [Bacillota bacterium]